MKMLSLSGLAIVSILTMGGCAKEGTGEPPATAATPAAATAAAPVAGREDRHLCPMDVPGTTVRAADTPNGVALEFATASGTESVKELKRRIHEMSERGMLGHMAGPGGGHGSHGDAESATGATDQERAKGLPSRMIVEDTDTGARVVLAESDPTKIESLRKRARSHAERMQGGECHTGQMHK